MDAPLRNAAQYYDASVVVLSFGGTTETVNIVRCHVFDTQRDYVNALRSSLGGSTTTLCIIMRHVLNIFARASARAVQH